MREMARVWNLHDQDYVEDFKEKTIVIPAKKYIVMDPSDADLFLKKYTPVRRDASGRDIAPKMLKKELFKTKEKALKTEAPKWVCMIDSQQFQTQKAYDDHVKENHLDQIVDKDSRDAFIEEDTVE